jgi:hypothetical protein
MKIQSAKAGIGTGRAGLQAASGLFSTAGLFDKGVKSFHPNDLDPYLLFDAETSMIGTLENPTLDLDPANPSTLDVITATRSGVATFTDANGVIQSASANTVRVDHTQGAELTPTKFQRFVNTAFDQAYWSFSSQMGSPVYNYDTAPNGEQEATRIVSNGGSYPQIVETITGLTVGQEYTASFYVKSDGTSQIQQSTHVTGVGSTVNFTPTNEWQRISVIITATATTHNFVIFTSNSSAPASSYLIWGPQFEEGTTASDFVANTTGSPKFITGPTFGPRVPMILVEPTATNLVTHSDFSGGWQEYLINSSAGSGYASQPSRIITSTGANAAYYIPVATSNGVSYTASIWARRVSGSGGCNIIYLSSPTAKQSISLTSEFQKFTATFTGKSGGGNVNFGVDIVTSGDSIEIAMPQVETGSVSTSYIPTSGSTAQRAADNLEITGSAFTDFFSSSEGTFYAEYQFNDADGANSLIYGSADNQRFAYKNLGSSSPLLSYDGVNVLNYGRLAAGTLLRTALSFDSNTMEGSQDGSAATMSNQTAPFPHTGNFLTASKLHIGSDTNGGKQLNGHIKRLLFWPYHSDSL